MTSKTKYSTLEQLLHDYKQNGVDSEGRFTLNPVRARQLLEQFQLPEPAHYAVHIVCFLIGAGASKVAISAARSQVRFEAPGASLEKDTVSNPFSVLLRSGGEPHLSELALGLNAFLGREQGALQLSFQNWRARYDHKTIEVTEEKSCPVLSIVAEARIGEKGADRELELIKEFFRWSPVPIKIQGEILPNPFSPEGFEGFQIHLKNESYPLLLEPFEGNRISKTMQAPFSALIRVGRRRPGFRIVPLGREYQSKLPWSFFLPGWQVDISVNSDRFKKDLSQQSILHNEIYNNLIQTLRAQLEEGCRVLLTHTPPLPGSENLVDDLVEHLFLEGRGEEAWGIQRRLCDSLSFGSDALQRAKAHYRLALLEKALGKENTDQKLGLALNMLERVHGEYGRLSRWFALKANLAFNPKAPHLEPKVQDLLYDSDTPPTVKEHCYRWLLTRGHQDSLSQSWYQVCLARHVFEAGRAEEAEEILDRVEETIPDPGVTLTKHQRDIDIAELRAEIAVSRGQLEKSLEQFGRQLALLREKHGQYSLKLGLTLKKLVALLNCAGQTKQAKEYNAWSKRLFQ